MNRYTVSGLVLILLSLLGVWSCRERRLRADDVAESREAANPDAEAIRLADSVMASMDVREKAAQLVMPASYASADAVTLARLREYAREGVGGIVLLKGDTASVKAIASLLGDEAKVPMWISADAETGLDMRFKGAYSHPAFGTLGRQATEQYMFRLGKNLGNASRKLGINMILGPVLDVSAPEGFIGSRSLGEDAARIGMLGTAYARGLESAGVVSVAKHFPGHGAARGDSHRLLPVVSRSLHQLDSADLKPFKLYVAQGLSGIMVGHLAVAAIDPTLQSATVSPSVMTDLLRGDLGFKGLIVTDALNMEGAGGSHAFQAIAAGADLVLAPADTKADIKGIVEAVADGRIYRTELDAHVRRVLVYKFLFLKN